MGSADVARALLGLFVLLALGQLIAAGGCGGDGPAELCQASLPEACQGFAVRGCRDSVECPPATACRQNISEGIPISGSRALYPDGCDAEDDCERDARMHCVVTAEVDRDALIAGFGVPGFLLRRASPEVDDSGALVWSSPPEDAVLVQCALFVCEPVVRPVATDDEPRLEIANYEQCVARDQQAPPDGAFDVQFGASTSGALARHATGYWAGCWAYSQSELVAATLLEPLEFGEVGPIPGVVEACTDEAEDMACPLVGQGTGFGTCTAGECRNRCVTDRDCGCETSAEGNTFTTHCAVRHGDYVGVCVVDPSNRCPGAGGGGTGGAGGG
ncbi:MAG: hypothetical protein KC731_20660 [Myxococcales bacterium]|nr:hypothetical protein [Myxococcales bacterium]